MYPYNNKWTKEIIVCLEISKDTNVFVYLKMKMGYIMKNELTLEIK